MAAPTTVPEVIAAKRHVANGATLNFPYTFAIETVGDILVMMGDVVQSYPSQYWVTGVGSTSGGEIQFTFFPPDGMEITILRAQDIQQLVNLLANSSYPPTTILSMHNRHTAVDQMLSERIDRAIKFDPQSAIANVAADDPIGNYLLKYNSLGTRVESISIDSVVSNTFVIDEIKTTIGTDPFLATVNYTASDSETRLLLTRGSVATPREVSDATLIAQKISNVDNNSASNPAIYASHIKYAGANLNNVTALFAEAEDRNGAAGTFIEGVRGNAVLTEGANGHADGVVASAQTLSAIGYKYLIGCEAEVINNSGADATLIFNNAKFSASFLATAQGTNLNSAGFMTNPFNGASAKFRAGFLVTEDSVDATTGAGFMDIGTHVHGLDLSLGAYSGAAILVPNNSPIRGKSFDGLSDLNIAYINVSDQLVLGFDTNATLIQGDVGTALATFDTTIADAQTALYLRRNLSGVYDLQRVVMGDADSGGAGFRMLRVVN